MIIIIRRVNDDWEQVWIDGELDYEGHSVPTDYWVNLLPTLVPDLEVQYAEDMEVDTIEDDASYIAPAPKDKDQQQPAKGLMTVANSKGLV